MDREAGAEVRAHQGEREGPGRLDEAGEGDCRAHREQGARATRSNEDGVSDLRSRHLVVTPRWPALGPRRAARADPRTVVQPGSEDGDRGPLEDEQAATAASGRPQEGRLARLCRVELVPALFNHSWIS